LYDLSSSSLLETFAAHTAPLWSLHVRPDGRGLVTGSADKDIKFWDFEVREVPAEVEGGAVTRVLTLAHVKTLKMTDDVLAVKYSPDGRLLAVSLLDSTVKVFYADTLKFFLSLYGHKVRPRPRSGRLSPPTTAADADALVLVVAQLPVLSLDISSDSKLIVTCSADKNIKIWGLDFGDCHRSLFAHDESVMQVAFERGSHLFWSVGKDRMVKYWDGDKVRLDSFFPLPTLLPSSFSSEKLTLCLRQQFECVQKLAGHSGEVWALAVSYKGNFVVSGSHDKSIRIWEKTEEPVRRRLSLSAARPARRRRKLTLYLLHAAFPRGGARARARGDVRQRVERARRARRAARPAVGRGGPRGRVDRGDQVDDRDAHGRRAHPRGARARRDRPPRHARVRGRGRARAQRRGGQARAVPDSQRRLRHVQQRVGRRVRAQDRQGHPGGAAAGRAPRPAVRARHAAHRAHRRLGAQGASPPLLLLLLASRAPLVDALADAQHRTQGWQLALTSRVLFFLLRTHHSQIVATRALRPTMVQLKGHLRESLKKQKVRPLSLPPSLSLVQLELAD